MRAVLPVLYPLAIALPLLFAGNCRAPAHDPGPAVTRYGVLDGHEPMVRVWLRSLATESKFVVRGRQGLLIEHGGATHHADAIGLYGQDDGYLGVTGFDGPVRIHAPDGILSVGDHTYSGELQIRDGRIVNRVKLENYVLGVLRGELPLAHVPEDAAAAQAIAVRSYTLHYLLKRRDEPEHDYDVDDTTLFQRYVGVRFAPDDGHLRAGVQKTIGLYLSQDGEPLKAYYHSTCGGATAAVRTGLNRGGPAALQSVPCEACVKSKYYRWQTEISDDAWLRAAGLTGTLHAVRIEQRVGLRAARLELAADSGKKSFHAGELRLRLGGSRLRSTLIEDLERSKSGWVVRGGGWGHGVGLCQMGAIGFAGRGKDERWIVAHYYPGAALRRAY